MASQAAAAEGFVPIASFHDMASVQKMTYRKLGNTGRYVSALGLGASALGGVFHDVTERECTSVVHTALKAGINVIDTAPWYGQGKSEEMLGKALKGNLWGSIPREAYMLNTKVGRYEKEVENMFDFTAERVTRSVEESLARLGIGYIDCIQIHDMEFAPDLNIIVNQTLPALDKLRAAGKVKHIGITGYPLEQFRYVLEMSKVKVDVVLSYCRSTLLDSSLDRMVPYFQSKGVGIINAAPTAMGLLTADGPPDWHPAQDQIKAACAAARAVCATREIDIARLAIRSALENENIATTLVSTAKLDLLKSNIRNAQEGLSDSEKETLQYLKTKVFNRGDMHWEGIEVGRYFAELGVTLQKQRLYSKKP